MPKDCLKALIVDDEALARTDLHYMLSGMAEISAVSQCTNATEALSLLQEDVFDVIFLDIQMPGLDGLKAVKIINQSENPPKIVFVTAYDEHAVKAFELEATDYLVKPFSNRRLIQAVQKVLKAINSTTISSKAVADKNQSIQPAIPLNTTEQKFRKIPVDKGEGLLLLNLDEVRFIAASDDKVQVQTFEEQYLCRFSMTDLENRLSSQGFLRVHRGYLVNVQHILELQPFLNGTYNLIIDDKKQSIIPVSRSRVKSLRNLIGV